MNTAVYKILSYQNYQVTIAYLCKLARFGLRILHSGKDRYSLDQRLRLGENMQEGWAMGLRSLWLMELGQHSELLATFWLYILDFNFLTISNIGLTERRALLS